MLQTHCVWSEGLEVEGGGGGEKAEEEPMEQGEGGGAPKEATEGAEGKLPSISLSHTLLLFLVCQLIPVKTTSLVLSLLSVTQVAVLYI